MKTLDWTKLLSHRRLGKQGHLDPEKHSFDPARPPFQQDFDRIVFSTAFRRLQDKTQVFPLADNDSIHTRLTHSLETSCVGRSLGTAAGQEILRKHAIESLHPSDIGAIVATACLAHDIGNPPFGHSGEDAIRQWFSESRVAQNIAPLLSGKEQDDIRLYEGNAQGFRILSNLQMAKGSGGFRLT
ncbi:MAG TPA: dNTP triphosphohydrolase, partial [Candidatus Methylacidiphilales bacterium]